MPHTSILRHVFRHLVHFHIISDVVQPSLLGSALLYFPCSCSFIIFLVVSPSSFLNAWPFHLSRIFLRKVNIGSMVASFQMDSFLMWALLVFIYPISAYASCSKYVILNSFRIHVLWDPHNLIVNITLVFSPSLT